MNTKYRIKEENGFFTIEGKQINIKIIKHLFKKNETIKTFIWKKVDKYGILQFDIVSIRHSSFRIPQTFKKFKTIEEAKSEIERFKNEPKYHYL